MSGDIPPLPQYTFMAWCLVKAQGLYLFTFNNNNNNNNNNNKLHDLDCIGPFWILNLVRPSLPWSSNISTSLCVTLPSLQTLQPNSSAIVYFYKGKVIPCVLLT
jgi:hypothetical protein